MHFSSIANLRAGSALAALAIAFGAAAAQAQQAPVEGQNVTPAYSDEIVVTANKREQNLNDVGLTVTAISGEALRERKITSLEDVASVVPGLSYATSTANTPIFTLRGIGFQESSLGVYPAVSVYLDQIPLPFPVLAAHSAYDLERIEVLKGPQGTLFGQNSTGGAINYIAAKPGDIWEVGGDISYGRFNSIEGNAYISGPLSDTAGMRLAVTGKNTDDWQYSITRDDTNGSQSYIAGRLLLEYEPSDGVNLLLNLNGWRDKSDPQAQQLVGLNPQSPNAPVVADILASPFAPNKARAADWSAFVEDPGTGIIIEPTFDEMGNLIDAGGYVEGTGDIINLTPRADRRMLQAALRADIDLGGLTLTSLTSYTDFNQDQTIDQDGNALVTFDLERADGFIETFNQELRLANDDLSRFRWVIGANYEDSTTFENQLLRYFDNSNFNPFLQYINASGVTNRQDIENWAVFASTEFDLTEQLTLKAAGRYTDSTIDSSICSYTTPTGRVERLFGGAGINGTCFTFDENFMNGPPITGTLSEDNISWRFGADFQPNPDLLLYANVSRGYKAGSFPSLSTASFLGLLPVTQESVTAYEAGFKASLLNRAVQFNAAGFYYDYKDKQIRGKLLDATFGGLDALINVPKSRVYGAEAELTARPIEGLTVNAAVTYLNSKVTSTPLAPKNNNIFAQPDDFTGDPLPFTPEWSGLVNVDYRQLLPSGGTVFTGVSVSARTESDAAIGARRIPFPDLPTSFTRPDIENVFEIKGYATVDARLGYEADGGRWKVFAWGKNIFDEYYWTTVIPSNDSQARFAGMPATYGVTFGFKFD